MEAELSHTYLGHDSLIRSQMRLARFAAEDAVLVQVDVVDETHLEEEPSVLSLSQLSRYRDPVIQARNEARGR